MRLRVLLSGLVLLFAACKTETAQSDSMEDRQSVSSHKVVVYQVFTRLFGNTQTTNKPWGTIAENGVGKFNDFTDEALQAIRDLGVTHIWYTGVPHHAVITDYTAYGISLDDPDVVKGRAGSPYAVKDYYTVNPDLAEDPAKRLEEFQALIRRTHAHNLRVIIDIVPNHVARKYESLHLPTGAEGFGADDAKDQVYQRDNNFYYLPGESFVVPAWPPGYTPLGGSPHPLVDGQFEEIPAKWTGNGARKAQPDFSDWYETVKINYGVRPDGTKDFTQLPAGYDREDYKSHHAFWQTQDVPDSWIKFRDIALYWTNMGVDGFRFDMAEMVPVEFWSYLNSAIKTANPDAFLLAEIYNPRIYRDYIHLGKMDYLYDKVDLYDTLRQIVQGHASTDHISPIAERYTDIDGQLLRFLENHDEQRIASPAFAGDPRHALPAMTVCTTLGRGPVMLYFGQEVGEPAAEEPGFGDPTRTSIFDYIGVPHHQRWMNGGAFDGGQLNREEKALRDFYQRLLTFTRESKALSGAFFDLHAINREQTPAYGEKVHAFARYQDGEKLLILTNFSNTDSPAFQLHLPEPLVAIWELADGQYKATDQIYGRRDPTLIVQDGIGVLPIKLAPLESLILRVEQTE